MIKQAVHLPTQEDFNTYMKYAESKGRGRVDMLPIAPKDGPKRTKYKENTYVVYGDNMCLTHFLSKYQILTLQEAIEQDQKPQQDDIIYDKEIDRNKRYNNGKRIELDINHFGVWRDITQDIKELLLNKIKTMNNKIIGKDREPKTGDWVMVSDGNDHWVKAMYICTTPFTDGYPHKVALTASQINDFKNGSDYKHSTFRFIKPYEETKRDWIDKAFQEYDTNYIVEAREQFPKLFKEIILKHMPKVTRRELLSISCDNVFLLRRRDIDKLLESKGLLQE